MISKERLNKLTRIIADEDDEVVPAVTTGATSPISTTTPTGIDDNDEDDKDPILDYILQQIEQNKQKQIQNAQADYVQREQDAQKIVSDIEDFIKKKKH